MGVELMSQQHAIQKLLQQDPALLAKALATPIPDGPRIEEFSALQLAQAIEYEVNRCAATGWTKVQVTMTPDDALRLAAFLRRK
jgi:hypothetical protein